MRAGRSLLFPGRGLESSICQSLSFDCGGGIRMKAFPRVVRPVLLAACLLTVASASLNFLAGRTPFFSASAQQAQVVVVNAATFASDSTLAPSSVAAAFGVFKTQNDQAFVANTKPLPTTLGGIKVTINGVDAQLFFTSNSQINFIVP